MDKALSQRGGGLSIGEVSYQERTNYPLTLIASPGEELSLRLGYDEGLHQWRERSLQAIAHQGRYAFR